jgi:peptidylprolyl isomerase
VHRLKRLRLLLVAIPLIVVAGCGSSTPNRPEVTGPVYGPASPAASSVASLATDQLPTATGKFGEKPTVTFPAGGPPLSLHRSYLVEGTGPELQSGQKLVANYYGIVWGATTPFDNSYDKKTAAAFQIGVGQVVKGWDVGLVGVKEGSRVMLILGPSEGYGLAGNSQANIKGTDTLVFVIDVIKGLSMTQYGQADAAAQPAPANAPIAAGAPGAEPSLTFPAGITEPTENRLEVLYRGTGPAVALGTLLVQYVVYEWGSANAAEATWEQGGPTEITVSESVPELKVLIGIPVGSRVMLLLPGDEASGRGAGAFVMDLVYQPPVPA